MKTLIAVLIGRIRIDFRESVPDPDFGRIRILPRGSDPDPLPTGSATLAGGTEFDLQDAVSNSNFCNAGHNQFSMVYTL